MKFPSLSSTLRLLKPFSKTASKAKTNSSHSAEFTLYDKIEEIISIADIHSGSLEIVVKFYNLTEIQQQLAIVTLIEHERTDALEVILLSTYSVNYLIRGQTPLHFAIKIKNLNMVKLLIKNKADIEFKDRYKETALNCAVRTGNNHIIKYLLEQGAEANTQASHSSTPLEYVLHQGDNDSVPFLEKYSAKMSHSNLG